MLNKKVTLFISSCEKFSDLWELHLALLDKNWMDRSIECILMTDAPTKFKTVNVNVLCAGIDSVITDRIRSALKLINTKYVLFTLDDYLLINTIKTSDIEELINTMDNERLDYVRLYKYPKSRITQPLASNKNVEILTFDKRYDINLYPSIWKTSFLAAAIKGQTMDAWEFEVSLTPFAKQNGFKCARCTSNVFPIMDSVRKGAFLHKARKFVSKSGYYKGNRGVISYREETKLWGMRMINTYLPDPFRRRLKSIMRQRGTIFYSEE